MRLRSTAIYDYQAPLVLPRPKIRKTPTPKALPITFVRYITPDMTLPSTPIRASKDPSPVTALKLDRNNFPGLHWCPMVVKGKRTVVDLDDNSSIMKRLIYAFRNTHTNQYYIGKTGGTAQQRVGAHNTKFNNSCSEPLPTAVRLNPDHFEFSILHCLKPNENLCDFETLLIIAFDSVRNGYNQNYGGGGGDASYLTTPQKAEALAKTIFIASPDKKYYPAVKRNNKYFIHFTPSAKDVQGAVYAAKWDRKDTKAYMAEKVLKHLGEDVEEGFYIGATNNPERRAEEHFKDSRNADKIARGLLPMAISLRPEEFSVAIVAKNCLDPLGAERKVILSARKKGKRLFNITDGGNGSSRSEGHTPALKKAFEQLKKALENS